MSSIFSQLEAEIRKVNCLQAQPPLLDRNRQRHRRRQPNHQDDGETGSIEEERHRIKEREKSQDDQGLSGWIDNKGRSKTNKLEEGENKHSIFSEL